MTDKAISPLRQRMIEDMTVRHFAEKAQKDYVRYVKNFAAFLGGGASLATPEAPSERLGVAGLDVGDGAPMQRRHRAMSRQVLARETIISLGCWRCIPSWLDMLRVSACMST